MINVKRTCPTASAAAGAGSVRQCRLHLRHADANRGDLDSGAIGRGRGTARQ